MAKKFLDTDGLTNVWGKIKNGFVKKGSVGDNANFNTIYEGGMYRYDTSPQNAPSGAGTHGQLLVVRGANDTLAQLCFPYGSSRVYLRTGNPINSGSWHEWVELSNANHNHDSTYLKLSGGTMTGNIAYNITNDTSESEGIWWHSSEGDIAKLFVERIGSQTNFIISMQDDDNDLLILRKNHWQTGNVDIEISKTTVNVPQTINMGGNKVATEAFVNSKGYQTASQVKSLLTWSNLIGKPTIPTVNNPTITINQGGVKKGSFTLNQSGGATINLDGAGGGSTSSKLYRHSYQIWYSGENNGSFWFNVYSTNSSAGDRNLSELVNITGSGAYIAGNGYWGNQEIGAIAVYSNEIEIYNFFGEVLDTIAESDVSIDNSSIEEVK